MKLIGIQLENYACFEKCFVPLEPGLSVLVGRNNSGKTAILRGLTCLRSLPIGEQKQFEPEVHDYSWTSRVHRDFKIQVLFEAEPTDTYLLHESDAYTKEWLQRNRAEVIFHFSTWADHRLVSLEHCTFRCPQWEITIGAWEGEHFVQVWPDFQGRRMGVKPLGASHRGPVLPHGKDWLNFKVQPLLSALTQLKNVTLIDAHRVGTPRLPLQTATGLASNGSNLPQFLDTLQGNDRERFLQIEAFVTGAFPEYEAVNPSHVWWAHAALKAKA